MPARELREWQQYAIEEPIGEFRADLRAGIIAATIVSAMSGKAAKPIDYMPFHKRALAAPTVAPSAAATSAAAEAAAVTNALMKASSRLKHNVVRRKKGN